MFTKLAFMAAAVSTSSKDSWAITWHQWQAAYPTLSSTGTSRSRASAKASSPHSYQSTGLSACCSRYGLVALANRFAMAPTLPGRLLEGLSGAPPSPARTTIRSPAAGPAGAGYFATACGHPPPHCGRGMASVGTGLRDRRLEQLDRVARRVLDEDLVGGTCARRLVRRSESASRWLPLIGLDPERHARPR